MNVHVARVCTTGDSQVPRTRKERAGVSGLNAMRYRAFLWSGNLRNDSRTEPSGGFYIRVSVVVHRWWRAKDGDDSDISWLLSDQYKLIRVVRNCQFHGSSKVGEVSIYIYIYTSPKRAYGPVEPLAEKILRIVLTIEFKSKFDASQVGLLICNPLIIYDGASATVTRGNTSSDILSRGDKRRCWAPL
jgi:hypothetical protein